MKGRSLKERLGFWQTWFLQDPAGFIDALPEPWRTMGLAELTAGAWISGAWHARWRPEWRTAGVDWPVSLVVAFDADGGFLAAAEAERGRPGLLRLRRQPSRIEVHPYDGSDEWPVQLEPWNGWRAYRTARKVGVGWAAALQAAWPPAGPRYLRGGADPFAPPSVGAYRAWIARAEKPAPLPADGPTFAIEGDADEIASLSDQTWPRWREGPAEPGEVALSLAPGDRLAPDALAAFAQAFTDPAVAAVYPDEDRLDAGGARSDPVFKTAFDSIRLERQDYIGGAIARRVGAVGETRHLPRVLWRRSEARAWPVAGSSPHGALPKALVVVPTRDRASLLRGCAAGLLDRTDYPNLELCIVDNGSVYPETLALMAVLAQRPNVRVLRIDGPFDFPALNNAAAEGSDAELLAFLNDDTWVIEPGWLKAMAALAVRPDVGAVGAKLFYPDGRIQHAGVTLGLGPLGVAGHGFRGAPGDLDGPQAMLNVTRQVSAVTAACLAVGREKFAAVGGFDSTFQVAYNDVDLCLRLNARSWKTVWTPDARMVHLESATRGREASPERVARLKSEAERMHVRWSERLAADPFYHPGLYLRGERFALAERMRDGSMR